MNPVSTTGSACSMAALLAGATGLVGREVARQWAGPGMLHLLVRRAPAAWPPSALQSLLEVNYSALPVLPAAQQAFCCLGTTIAQAGSAEAFRAVDFAAVRAFARAAKVSGVSRFAVVSALGANAASRTLYNRVKGEMEAALRDLHFQTLVIARPSLLAGNRSALDQPPRSAERLALVLTAPLAPIIPKAWRPIQAASVARALLRALAQGKPGVQVLESAELQDLGHA